METPFEGGCACGAVRLQCSAYPLAMYNCHCRGCQKMHGAPYAPLLVLQANRVSLSGRHRFLKSHVREDPHPQRAVCWECGAVLFSVSDASPEILLINALALDDPGWFQPIADIWTSDAQPWVRMDTHIPKVFKSPPLMTKEVA